MAVIRPSHAFSVETTGCGVPAGHVVSQPRYLLVGRAVMLTEYAVAVEGMPQALAGMGNERMPLVGREGGP